MVPLVDLSRRGHEQSAEFARRVVEITERGTYLLGTETDQFEHELAMWAGAPGAVAVSSGAAALQVTLAALGIGVGDEVIVPAFTAVPTAAAVAALGAVPVMVDVEAHTANLDPLLIEAARTERTRAVIVVHLYGLPATLPDTDLLVVEDAAQAQGAVTDHRRSAAVAYSFYPTKNLGGIGDGGAVVSHDLGLLDRVRHLRVHGMTGHYVHESVSQNFRMSELESAWLRIGLRRLDGWNARRRFIAMRYRLAAAGLCWQASTADHVHHLCVVRVDDRDAVRASLADRGIATAVHYPLAITQQPAYRHLNRAACPEAEAWAASCVSVPCFPEMRDDEIDQVASALSRISSAVHQ